jgi:hypothetical protein
MINSQKKLPFYGKGSFLLKHKHVDNKLHYRVWNKTTDGKDSLSLVELLYSSCVTRC